MSKPGVFETTKYFVLLALSKEPAHGYALSGQHIADSVGGIYLRPSSLYSTLQSLEKAELITGTDMGQGRIYRLTPSGRRRLAEQTQMYERAARLGKERLGKGY